MSHLAGLGDSVSPGRRRGRRSLRLAIIIAGSTIVLAVASLVWVGIHVVLAKSALETAVPLAATLQKQIVAGDRAGAALSYRHLTATAAAAAELTADPVWAGYEKVWAVGPNLVAARELATVVHSVVIDGLKPLMLVNSKFTVSDFKPVGGAVNFAPLVAIQPEIAQSARALATASSEANKIGSAGTVRSISAAIRTLRAKLQTVSTAANALDRASRLIPAMLGADGPRNYLLLFQNPGELRATGGITGAFGLVHTENGRVKLVQQASTTDFAQFPQPVLPLDSATTALYGPITGQYIQDVNLTPDFTKSGPLAQEMWKRRFGLTVDGVLSVDPVTLSYLLRATGPITLPTGDVLSSATAVDLLLSQVYARYPKHVDQSIFFNAAASAVFKAVASGAMKPAALVAALAQAGSEHRVLLWSAHPHDQALLAATTLAGGLPVSDRDTLRFGVYFNDATGGKMDYYLATKLAIGQKVCRNDKRSTYSVEVSLKNTVSATAVPSLGLLVTGGRYFGVPVGHVRTAVIVYGPAEVVSLSATRDGAQLSNNLAIHDGRQVATTMVELSPGESAVLRFNWLSRLPSQLTGSLVATPIIHLPETGELTVAC